MKKILSIILFAAVLIFFACDEDEKPKRLTVTKYNQPGQECFNVECFVVDGDTVCYKDPGTPRAQKLPKSSVCYDNLKAADPPSDPIITPPVEKSPTYQFNIDFLDSTNKKFGYDPVKGSFDISTSLSERRINYFSIKKGGELKIMVSISSASRNMFSSFYMKTLNTAISFDSLRVTDSLALFNSSSNDTVDTISIYGKWSTFAEISIIIAGINRSGTVKCLVCNDTCDEAIIAKCYDERVIDSMRLFRVNNPQFNIADTIIRNTFNNILKQAVVRVKGVIKQNYTKMDWDKNGNGKLDIFPNRDSVPDGLFEQDTLRTLIEKDYNQCLSCASPDTIRQPAKVFILPSTINGNWILMDSAKVGDDSIIIQYSNDLENNFGIRRKINFKLQSWNGTNSETFQINVVKIPDNLIGKNRMIVKLYSYKLKNNHIPKEVLVYEQFALGFAYGHISCSWVNNNMNMRDILHEILHMRNIGRFQHTTYDTLNIMYPISKPYSLLRYRDVELSGSQEISRKQWDALNKRTSY